MNVQRDATSDWHANGADLGFMDVKSRCHPFECDQASDALGIHKYRAEIGYYKNDKEV